MPAPVYAGLFSSILSSEVSAADLGLTENSKNSQTMDLLEADVSPLSKNTDNTNINIVSDNALLATTGPMGVSDGTIDSDPSLDQMSIYVVREGDVISKIAEMYDVSVNTILWANDLKKGDKLTKGDILIILPIDGVKYDVAKGDTLKKIAEKYKVDVLDILAANDVTMDTQLTVGQKLIIPNAEIEVANTSSPSNKKANVQKTPTKNIPGYFINPVPNYVRRSQGYHGNNSIDLAAPTGTPIVAAASGKVLLARNGYNGGYGNMVIIQHPNGTTTVYGHMSKLATSSGAQVSQGKVIGYIGSTGHSTGPHLHFEVHGAKNPGTTTPMSWSKN